MNRLASILAAATIATASAASAATPADSIASAIRTYMSAHAAVELRDVYKHFMQDYFGPGHLLADTAAAGSYLRRELHETLVFAGPRYEPTGYRGNFMRVNLSVIADGTVPYDTYFGAFTRSVQSIVAPEPDMWRTTWNLIDSVITRSGFIFPDAQRDRCDIAARLRSGDFVIHHSEAFNRANDFHYRIISREIFVREILPLLTHPLIQVKEP